MGCCGQDRITTMHKQTPQPHGITYKATWSLTTRRVVVSPGPLRGGKEEATPKKAPPAVQHGGSRLLGWQWLSKTSQASSFSSHS